MSSDEIHQLQSAIDALKNQEEWSKATAQDFFHIPDSDCKELVGILHEELKEEKKHQQFHSSWTRTIIITLMTYIILGFYMSILGVKYPYYSAVIPATGFYLSTLSLSPIRNTWLKWCGKKSDTYPHDTVLSEVANPI
jgi:hypothetical protein